LQRLFSTFPAGLPGIGLLILRLGAGVPLIYSASEDLLAASDAARLAFNIVEICVGILLLIGLWTPVAGAIAAVAGLWTLFSQPAPDEMCLGVFGASLALLGPGAWSVDARLFGRKLFVTGQRPRRGHSKG
jgi:putative oxidoreductase